MSKKSLRKEVIDRMLAQSNLGVGLNKTFDNFLVDEENEDALTAATTWCQYFDDEEKGLLFYGPTGVGKTHLGCAIANHMIVLGVFTYRLSTPAMPKHDSDQILSFTDPDMYPILFLDDLGSEKLTERSLECLQTIIDGRIWNSAKMIVTTNYIPEDLIVKFGDEYGDRLVGRLQECCAWYPIGGSDRRRCWR